MRENSRVRVRARVSTGEAGRLHRRGRSEVGREGRPQSCPDSPWQSLAARNSPQESLPK